MDNRPSAEAPGVDVSAVKALDPSFDDQEFLTIARESFYSVREARGSDKPSLADAEFSAELMAQLRDVVQGDVASHRHHLLPGLEVRSAVIGSVDVTGGKFTLVVRFHLSSEELDRANWARSWRVISPNTSGTRTGRSGGTQHKMRHRWTVST